MPACSRATARAVCEIDARLTADLFQSLQREVATREHPLHACFAQSQSLCDAGVGRALPLEDALQRIDKHDGLHRIHPRAL